MVAHSFSIIVLALGLLLLLSGPAFAAKYFEGISVFCSNIVAAYNIPPILFYFTFCYDVQCELRSLQISSVLFCKFCNIWRILMRYSLAGDLVCSSHLKKLKLFLWKHSYLLFAHFCIFSSFLCLTLDSTLICSTKFFFFFYFNLI